MKPSMRFHLEFLKLQLREAQSPWSNALSLSCSAPFMLIKSSCAPEIPFEQLILPQGFLRGWWHGQQPLSGDPCTLLATPVFHDKTGER